MEISSSSGWDEYQEMSLRWLSSPAFLLRVGVDFLLNGSPSKRSY
jgi:hypothetical protein